LTHSFDFLLFMLNLCPYSPSNRLHLRLINIIITISIKKKNVSPKIAYSHVGHSFVFTLKINLPAIGKNTDTNTTHPISYQVV
jgi:hypothetical protein